MSTVKISSALPDQVMLAAEIAQLRELDVSTLRARWRVVFRKDAPFHLPRHLLMRVLAYRLQARNGCVRSVTRFEQDRRARRTHDHRRSWSLQPLPG